jgi:hypothetical protein
VSVQIGLGHEISSARENLAAASISAGCSRVASTIGRKNPVLGLGKDPPQRPQRARMALMARRAAVSVPPLTGLSKVIYNVLRLRVPTAGPAATLTYTQLARQVGVGPRARIFHLALGDLVRRCRMRSLPALPALVVRADLGMPGAGYYPTAHRGIHMQHRPRAALAWAREVTEVCHTKFPRSLWGSVRPRTSLFENSGDWARTI